MLRLKPRLLLGLEAILILSVPLASLANNNSLGGYEASPKPKQSSQRRSVAGGTRSYCQNLLADGDLSLIVPEEEVVHRTATNRPSFFFHSQVASSTPLKFTLVNPKIAEPLVETSLLIEKPGYYKIKLPDSVSLEPQRTYLWHLAIPCSNNPAIFQEVLVSAVEYSPVSSPISTRLERANSLVAKSQIYARQGIWYDALDLAHRARSQTPQYWQQLLANISLSSSEATSLNIHQSTTYLNLR